MPTRCEANRKPAWSPTSADPALTVRRGIHALLRPTRWIDWLAGPWAVPIALCIIMGPMLLGQTRLAYRDVSFFYTPLYGWLGDQEFWGITLWNDFDGVGMPTAGETTPAVFYPLRIAVYVFCSDWEMAIAWYTWLHLSIASWTSRKLAAATLRTTPRRTGTDGATTRTIIGICGWAYAMSGSVFHLNLNPPFLVSAAWLPLAWLPLVNRSWRSVAFSAMAMALMVLGGDPQTALHAVLVWAAVIVGRTLWTVDWRTGMLEMSRLWTAASITALAALPQLAASLDWAMQSDRRHGLDDSVRLAFSVAPWQLWEWLCVNAWGDWIPVHGRLSKALRHDPGLWVADLSAGPLIGLGTLLAVMSLRLPKRFGSATAMGRSIRMDRGGRASMWAMIAVATLVLSWGKFGLLWWWPSVWETGGGGVLWTPYRWLVHCVPGYDAFRYPAKWLPLVTLACILCSVPSLVIATARQVRVAAWTFVALIAFHLGHLVWLRSSDLPPIRDELWGPLQFDMGLRHAILGACVSTGSILVCGWTRQQRWSRQTKRRALLSLVVVPWLVMRSADFLTVDRQLERQRIAEAKVNHETHRIATRGAPLLRHPITNDWPRSWRNDTSPQRLLEVAASQRAIGFGRWHLEHRVAMLNSMVSIQSAALREEFEHANAMEDAETVKANSNASGPWRQLMRQVDAGGHWFERGELHNKDASTIVLPAVRFFDTTPHRASGRTAVVGDFGHQGEWVVQSDESVTLTRAVLWTGPDRWWAVVTSEGASPTTRPVLPDGRLRQQLRLPAGKHRVRWVYRPWYLWPSVVVCGMTWFGIIAWVRPSMRANLFALSPKNP